MKATDILMEEHRVIEGVIGTLETAAQQVNAGERVRPGFFLDAAQFITGFADGCHHVKEENVLFRTMTDNGLPVQGSPVGVMLLEHDQGRFYTRSMRAAAERWQAGDEAASREVVQNALGYAALLRQHIAKEDGIVFPLAEKLIPVDQQDAVNDGFDHIEHVETGEGIHEKYLGLANSMQAEINRN